MMGQHGTGIELGDRTWGCGAKSGTRCLVQKQGTQTTTKNIVVTMVTMVTI